MDTEGEGSISVLWEVLEVGVVLVVLEEAGMVSEVDNTDGVGLGA